MAEDKGFKPTEKRLEKARRDGFVLRSQVLTQALAAIAVSLACYCQARLVWVRKVKMVNYCFAEGSANLGLCLQVGWQIFFWIVWGTLLAGTLVSILAEALQVGFRVEVSIVSPRAARLNPARGLSRIKNGWAQTGGLVLGAIIPAAILYWFYRNTIHPVAWELMITGQAEPASLIGRPAEVLTFCLAAILLCGIGDYLRRRHRFYRDLSMSAHELRLELKEHQGDPLVRAIRRQMHETLTKGDLLRRIRKAKVVLVEKKTVDCCG